MPSVEGANLPHKLASSDKIINTQSEGSKEENTQNIQNVVIKHGLFQMHQRIVSIL